MTNITPKIKAAIIKDVLWALKEFDSAIEYLKANNYKIDYSEVDENWAIIIRETKVAGYLWSKYPLIMIEDDLIEKMISKKSPYIEAIKVKNFQIPELTIDLDEIADYFDYFENYSQFSAVDFWIETNSK